MKRAFAALAALLAGCAGSPSQPAAESAPQSGYALRMAESAVVPFHGVVDFDAAGVGTNAMLYGPGAAAALGGLIAHAVILSSSRETQKAEIQKQADLVLEPYAPVLSAFRQNELLEGALAAAPGSRLTSLRRPAAGDTWIISSTPSFAMTQDQSALVLDNAIVIHRGGDAVYRNTVRVVSTPHSDGDPQAWWTANDGERIKAESVALHRDSLDLALRDLAKTEWAGAPPQKTVRYREGRVERMERAEILAPECDRALIRTLRGALMSVPLSDPSGPCVVQVPTTGE